MNRAIDVLIKKLLEDDLVYLLETFLLYLISSGIHKGKTKEYPIFIKLIM